jgi:hypothetical protein
MKRRLKSKTSATGDGGGFFFQRVARFQINIRILAAATPKGKRPCLPDNVF